MRARGVFGFSATGDVGATATCSVAASICRGLRRQNAIESLPLPRTGSVRFWTFNALLNEAAPVQSPETITFARLRAIQRLSRGQLAAKIDSGDFGNPAKDAR
jgi:hypothetical protein